MKKHLSALICLCLFICISACEYEQIIMPTAKKNTGFSVDFNYNGNSFVPGFVRFINNSKGDVRSEWNFGSYDANGKFYTSDARSPTFVYPKNGIFRVTLTIYNEKNQSLSISQAVNVASIDTGGGRGGTK